jgi:16S rRNA (guanine966-N2)-methyltransferase
MRIVAGNLKGRIFDEPRGHRTHPMSEKVRGALFNALGDIEGLAFLDAFAGSGALGFEAISRGAGNVVAVEKDPSSYKVIENNILELKLQKQISATRANVSGWSMHNMEKQFDILLLDPPYGELQINLLQKLISRHVKKDSIAVLSYPGKQEAPSFEGSAQILKKEYGDAQLIFYRKENR